ncbi:condensation domain-containing protein, partial [Legionella oakridgensis]|uniref:condensation domain-containing protein n=1 Tax=Legionella oakridgensis TaxID=29423 RepID=UPI00055FBFF7
VCQIWQEVLKVSSVGIDDDFFELGGHSILAMQVAHQMSLLLRRDIAVAELFSHRTVRAFCEVLPERGGLESIAVFKGSRAPLSYAQERLWFAEQYEKEVSPYHILLKRKYSSELLDGLQRVVARHEVLRTRFVQDELGTYQEVHNEPLCVEKISNPEEFFCRKFDLTLGHPLRVGLYDGYLLVVFHHIAFDEWSLEQLHQELSGHEVALEIQYKDFAVWQRSEVESRWDELCGYWLEK